MEGEHEPLELDDALDAFDPDLDEDDLDEEDEDESLLDLLSDRLDEIHPRLTRSLGDGWYEGDGEPAA